MDRPQPQKVIEFPGFKNVDWPESQAYVDITKDIKNIAYNLDQFPEGYRSTQVSL